MQLFWFGKSFYLSYKNQWHLLLFQEKLVLFDLKSSSGFNIRRYFFYNIYFLKLFNESTKLRKGIDVAIEDSQILQKLCSTCEQRIESLIYCDIGPTQLYCYNYQWYMILCFKKMNHNVLIIENMQVLDRCSTWSNLGQILF